MKQPARLQNPQSKELIVNDLSSGLENNLKRSGLTPGSCYTLNNAYITESNAIKAVTGYNSYLTEPGYKLLGIPLNLSESLPGALSEVKFCVGVNGDQVCLVKFSSHRFEHVTDLPKDYSTSATYRLLLMDGKLLIYNGVDNPVLFDITNNKLIQWVPLKDPTATPTVATNLPSPTEQESVSILIAVAFRSTIGHTKASPKATLTIGKNPAVMTGGDYINITRPTEIPEGATGWDVYMVQTVGEWDSNANIEMFAINDNPIPIENTVFVWNEATRIYLDKQSPIDNTTIPIVFNYAEAINNRIWVTQITKGTDGLPKPYMVAWSGTGANCYIFGSSSGAGFVSIEDPSENVPQSIHLYRDNQNSPHPVVLTGSPISSGRHYTMLAQSVNVSQRDATAIQTFVPQAELSSVGTVAGHSAIAADLILVYLSDQGLISTQTNRDTFNVLSNNIISLKIRSLITDIPHNYYSKIEVCYSETRVFWLLYNKNGDSYVLIYDFVKQCFSILDTPVEHIFIDTSLENQLNLGFIKDGKPYYYVTDQDQDVPIRTTVMFNYTRLSNARVNRVYGRLLDSYFGFESVEPELIHIGVNGITKDDIRLEVDTVDDFIVDDPDVEYRILKAHARLYRDKIITDEVQAEVSSVGTAWVLTYFSHVFNVVQSDYDKNRFQRTLGTLDSTSNNKTFVLQPTDSAPAGNYWLDESLWDDDKVWID